jgi:hypothetical protein
LHPVAEWGRQRFGGANIPAERRVADLESSLTQVKLDPQENAALLAPLLDMPLPAERAPALAPEELRRRQLAALTNWVLAGAHSRRLVLFAARILRIALTIVVLPTPGPPVMTSTLAVRASRIAAVWLSARASPTRFSTHGRALSGSGQCSRRTSFI